MGIKWNKSSFCSSGNCAEVAKTEAFGRLHYGVRSSVTPADPVWFTSDEWAALVQGIKAGEFD